MAPLAPPKGDNILHSKVMSADERVRIVNARVDSDPILVPVYNQVCRLKDATRVAFLCGVVNSEDTAPIAMIDRSTGVIVRKAENFAAEDVDGILLLMNRMYLSTLGIGF